MLEISSAQNQLFKDLLSLTESKGLKKSDRFLIFGENLVNEFADNFSEQIVSEIFCEDHTPKLPTKLRVKLSKDLFKQLDVLGTRSRILVAKKKELPQVDFKSLGDGIHLLIPVGDPANLGAALRSAAGFNATSVILLKEAASIYLPKSVKAAAGATFNLNLLSGPSIQEIQNLAIKDLGTSPILALDSRGDDLQNFKWPKKCFLLVGEEGAGIPTMTGLKTISIATQNIESLNATVALSIALYDRQTKGSK